MKNRPGARVVGFTGIAIAALYAAFVAFVMFRASGASRTTGSVVPMLLFFLWASSPVVVLACVAYRGEGGVGKVIDLLRLAAVCALVISGAAAYQVGFFGSHPDAQSGLLFVFVPLYQWFAVVVVFLLLVVVKHAYHRRRGT